MKRSKGAKKVGPPQKNNLDPLLLLSLGNRCFEKFEDHATKFMMQIFEENQLKRNSNHKFLIAS